MSELNATELYTFKMVNFMLCELHLNLKKKIYPVRLLFKYILKIKLHLITCPETLNFKKMFHDYLSPSFLLLSLLGGLGLFLVLLGFFCLFFFLPVGGRRFVLLGSFTIF